MNAWIILLFLLMGNRGCCKEEQDACPKDDNCGCGRENNRNNGGRNREQDCGCDCDDSRFEPRFDSRPFRDGRETCGCEEKDN